MIAEYSTATPPSNPTTSYTITDQLGSPRVIVNALGQVVSRRDFLPFGEEVEVDGTYRTPNQKYGQNDSVRQRFTGYQKDEETKLDFAEARMYENRHGRFTAIDPLLSSGKSANPQTFNRYVYVMNNPLAYTDPSGLQAGTKPDERKIISIIRVGGLPPQITYDGPYERTILGEPDGPSLGSVIEKTVLSAIVTFAENNGSESLLGTTDIEHNQLGRAIGHTVSLIQGVSEISAGSSVAVAGGGLTVTTSPACATVVGCAVPATTGTAAVLGAATAVHGALVIGNTLNNIGNQDGGGGSKAIDYNLEGRGKIKTGEDALDQLEGISEAQKNVQKGKGTSIIDSTKKSEQRVDNKNRKLRNLDDAYDEYPDY